MSFSLSGLASGLDTTTIITQLMQLERIPYTQLEAKQRTYNTEQATFRTINTKLNTLRTAAEDLLLSSSFNIRSATNSDESVLRVVASEGADEASYTIEVERLATRHSVKLDEVDVSSGAAALTGSFKIAGMDEAIELEGDTNDEKLIYLMNEINKADVGVKAVLIESGVDKKTLVLTADQFGEDNQISISENTLSVGTTTVDYSDAIEAQNAIVHFNGVRIESNSNELSNVVPGLSLTLLKEDASTTVSIAKDADKITEKVEAFVNAYNDVIETIRANNGEGRGLQGDSTLRSLQSQLHNLFNAEVGGNTVHKYLHSIGLEIDRGITTGSLMTGKINFDKEKFQEALVEHPDEVFNLFALHEGEQPGIARRFTDSLRDWTRAGTGILTMKIEGYNNEISFITKQMEDMEVRLQMREDQLRRQFTAMESALVQLQNQQAWMASQLASMYAQMG